LINQLDQHINMENSATIVGGGSVGWTMAADFIERKKDRVMVHYHENHSRNADAVKRKGHLLSTGELECLIRMGEEGDKLTTTTSMSEAVAFSNVMFLTIPATGYDTTLTELTQNDLSKHLVTLIPGNLSARIVFLAFMRIEPKFRPHFVLETSTSPHPCRIEDGSLHVFAIKEMVHMSSLPVDLSRALQLKISAFFPKQVEWCRNVLEVDFLCVNPVIHMVLMLMNTGLIYRTKGDFSIYDMPDEMVLMIEAADGERVSALFAYTGRKVTLLQIGNAFYKKNFTSLKELFRSSTIHALIKGPPDLDHRMLDEEAHVVAGWIEFCKAAKIKCPTFKSLVHLAKIALKRDYRKIGRTLERLGLRGLSPKQILDRYNATQATLVDTLRE